MAGNFQDNFLTCCFSCDDRNLALAIREAKLLVEYSKRVDVVIVVQNLYGKLDERLIRSDWERIAIYRQEGVGLSRSRNYAISKASGKYVWLLDGDVRIEVLNLAVLLNEIGRVDLRRRVHSIFVRIRCLDSRGEYKNYRFSGRTRSLVKLLTTSSVEIIFNRECCVIADIQFDERLGLGTGYPATEEVDFLIRLAMASGIEHYFLDLYPVLHACSEEDRLPPSIGHFIARGVLCRKLNVAGYFVLFYWALKFYLKHRRIRYISAMFRGFICGEKLLDVNLTKTGEA